MSLFKKKGLEQLKNDFPAIKLEVSKIVVEAMVSCNVKYSNLSSTTSVMHEEVAKQLKKKLGYSLDAGEVSSFLTSSQFLQMGAGNEVAGKMADDLLK